jgi:septal ring factor EnvC (AmiA/AmiB activator)
MEHATEREAEQQPAVEAAILDRLLKIEDHVSTMRTQLETHISGAGQRQSDLLAAITEVEKAQKYYGDQLIRSFHRLERLYKRIDQQLALHDIDLGIAAPPEPPN